MSVSKKISEDIDLMREFESLKLKQNLLVESLKHKHKQEENDKKIDEVYQTLQRLLDVFLEAKDVKKKTSSNGEDEENSVEKDETLSRIETKLDTIQKDISELQEKLKLNSSEHNTARNIPSPSLPENKNSGVFNSPQEKSTQNNLAVESSKKEDMPQIPKTWGASISDGDNKL